MPDTFKLKYLFIAEFSDGTLMEQTPEDVSKTDPSKSEFYDLLQSGKRFKTFSLVGDGHKVSVNLLAGTFTVDGLPLLLESDKLPTLPDRFELIFYRQHTHSLNTEYLVKTGKITNVTEGDHRCEYFIGWQCNIAGKNYQQKLAVV